VEGVPDLDLDADLSLSDTQIEISRQFNKDAMKAYRNKDYKKAIDLFIKALEKNPANLLFRYNLACTYALNGDKDKSLGILRQLKETEGCARCFIRLARAAKDSDFDSIREDAEFKKLVEGAPQRLAAELKAAKWLEYKANEEGVPIRTNGLPAISSDGKRIAAAHTSDDAFKLEILQASTGNAINSRVLVNPNELAGIVSGDGPGKDMKAPVSKRINKAHRVLIGREWIEFKIDAGDDLGEEWLDGTTAQQFKLGKSTIKYDYPELIVTNSAGNKAFKGKLGQMPDDDCTQYCMITDARVNGQFHTMLFYIDNFTTQACSPMPGRYYVLKLN